MYIDLFLLFFPVPPHLSSLNLVFFLALTKKKKKIKTKKHTHTGHKKWKPNNQKTNKSDKNPQIKKQKGYTNTIEVPCVGQLFLAMGPAVEVWLVDPLRFCWRKLAFPLPVGYQLRSLG